MKQRRLCFRQKWLVVQSVGSSAYLWESRIRYSAACAGGRLEIFSEQNNVEMNAWLPRIDNILDVLLLKRLFTTRWMDFLKTYIQMYGGHTVPVWEYYIMGELLGFFSFHFTPDDA